MNKYRAVATMITYAEVIIEANNEQEAYDIADQMDGGDFTELVGKGGWSIEILSAD